MQLHDAYGRMQRQLNLILMTRTSLSLAILLSAAALQAPDAAACTNLIAGPKATTDGSVFMTYSADSHNLYGMLNHTPAAKHAPGAMRKVVEWDTSKPLGEIPQPAETYNVVGNINEFQVAIGESTWGGHEELVDTTGNSIIDYGSLIQIALERSKTAREAIKVMTDLVDKYGYASSGESFSIADKNEVWVMEMIGKGAEKGAVWIAVRIPDNAISGHANEPRIRKVDFKDKENVMHSKDVISFARRRGYFNGKDADFSLPMPTPLMTPAPDAVATAECGAISADSTRMPTNISHGATTTATNPCPYISFPTASSVWRICRRVCAINFKAPHSI